ncbi:DUF4864 domain-containing protein [Pontibacter akesuensis]|uniref:DUF4864 domain-containing protein n=1 Tax=Pontibacter akesuensis TaxID=388950 RepID=A0A1I7IG53_9BACT|nr:DUF4864 domain-containing protein [Pontibacter akesuensis]GHA67015.1 hypothetical protein GCM10007389_20170 [Pontibacter akesuensis]SFU71892.1 protein of unknown function [Pontibacter akesuensis]
MKKQDNVFDKIMLAIGLLLLVLFWFNFPAIPNPDNLNYITYTSSGAESSYASKWTYIKPDKALSAEQVINIQLRALQQNDRADSGVITVFNFSSPLNRMHLGPLEHFRLMVRDPSYRPMLNFKSYKKGQLVISGKTAYQLVVLEAHDGQQEAFMFILAKQRKGAYKDCWMTEGIARMDQTRDTKVI